MEDRKITTSDGYTINYAGGRLADVIINGVAVECVQVRDYGWEHGTFGPVPTDDEIRARVREFLNPDDMTNYEELARFYH